LLIPATGKIAVAINSTATKIVNSNKTTNNNSNFFSRCFIEASGDISNVDWPRIIGSNMWKMTWFRPFNDDRAIVSYWQLVFDSSSEIRIYSEENGELLWEHDGNGHPQIRILGYYGIYVPSNSDESSLHVSINGKALLLLMHIR